MCRDPFLWLAAALDEVRVGLSVRNGRTQPASLSWLVMLGGVEGPSRQVEVALHSSVGDDLSVSVCLRSRLSLSLSHAVLGAFESLQL